MTSSLKLDELIRALRLLPGVGPKSAQRMAFHLMERGRTQATQIASALQDAITHVGHCQWCNNFCDEALCTLCLSPKRDEHLLCIVETPADVSAIEQSCSYSGRYFVLMGHLSPLDGIGPEEIHLNQLVQHIKTQEFQEIIIATNPTVEGEATAHYIADMLRPHGLKVTRIAHGVPLGGELEYVDGGTLAKALLARETL